VPLPGIGSALALLGRLAEVFGQPLATDVLHHGVLRSLGGLEDLPDQRTRSARLQLHRQQVRGSQLTAQQVGFDLQAWEERESTEYFFFDTTVCTTTSTDFRRECSCCCFDILGQFILVWGREYEYAKVQDDPRTRPL